MSILKIISPIFDLSWEILDSFTSVGKIKQVVKEGRAEIISNIINYSVDRE